MMFGEIEAWNQEELAHDVIIADMFGIVGMSGGPWTDIFGNADDNKCKSFLIGTHPPAISFDLPASGQISDIAVYGGNSITWDTITVTVQQTDNTWVACGSPIDFTSGSTGFLSNSASVNCGSSI